MTSFAGVETWPILEEQDFSDIEIPEKVLNLVMLITLMMLRVVLMITPSSYNNIYLWYYYNY